MSYIAVGFMSLYVGLGRIVETYGEGVRLLRFRSPSVMSVTCMVWRVAVFLCL